MAEWQQFRARNPGAKLACIDVQPYAAVQARSGEDVLNVGGFSDAVFEALASFARGELAGDAWVKKGRARRAVEIFHEETHGSCGQLLPAPPMRLANAWRDYIPNCRVSSNDLLLVASSKPPDSE
jgi:hypothetical protein